MLTWVALLKGVNVGGHNRIPMVDLRAAARDLGWVEVSSYIASGNLVFRANGPSTLLEQVLGGTLQRRFGVDVPVYVIRSDEFAELVLRCPFDPSEAKLVHGFVCRDTPVLDHVALKEAQSDEQVEVAGNVIWLHTPSGFSGSKVAKTWGRISTGADMTARNLNTFRKLAEKLDALVRD